MEHWEAFAHDLGKLNDNPEPEPLVDDVTENLDELLLLSNPGMAAIPAGSVIAKRGRSSEAAGRELLDRLFATHGDDHGFIEKLRVAHEKSKEQSE